MEIRIDRFGVPHILAEDEASALFALGYMNARDRLWQMEYLRRVASGRWAEIAGPSAVRQDFLICLLRVPALAKQLWENQPKTSKTRSLLIHFVNGINFWVERNEKNLPPEFETLRLKPEKWTPEDVIRIFFLQGLQLSRQEMENRLEWMAVCQKKGEKWVQFAYPEERLGYIVTTEEGKGIFGLMMGGTGKGARGHSKGSNNWVVDGTKSASGYPILCNDPHLTLSTPPPLYEVHVKGGNLNVIGAMIPGLPFPILGHNGKVAWGVTYLGVDIWEVYREKVDRRRKRYLSQGEWKPLSVTQPVVRVKVFPGVKIPIFWKKFYATSRGLIFWMKGQTAYTVRWAGWDMTCIPMDFVFDLMNAGTVQDFREGLKHYPMPAQNWVMADVQGNIAYQAAGWIPKRKPGWRREVLDADSPIGDWEGPLSLDELPHLENPKWHFIATANNPPSREAEQLPGDFGEEYRAWRIVQMLQEKDKLSVEDMINIQADTRVMQALIFKQMMLRALDEKVTEDKMIEKAIRILEQWDNRADEESVGATLFRFWFHFLGEAYFEGEEGSDTALYLGFDREPDKLKALTTKSLTQAVETLIQYYGKDPQGWKWKVVHRIRMRHALERKIKGKWTPPLMSKQGDAGTVDVGYANLEWIDKKPAWVQDLGAMYRFIVEMTSPPKARGVLPGGNSGNPTSPHFQDQLSLWLNNSYHPLFFTEKEIEENTEERILITR